MASFLVTYNAPADDADSVKIFGHRFFDGETREVELSDHALMKLRNNPHFQVQDGGDDILAPAPAKKRGRPPKADAITIEHDDEGGE